MRGIFSVDGKFYTITSKIVDLVIITLLWFIGCIPIVTILTSTSSMYHTVVKCVRYDRGSVFKDFKEAYKNNLKQGIVLTLLFGCIGALIAFIDYQVFVISANRSVVFFVLTFGMLVFSILYLLNVLWIIPVFSRFSDTTQKILQLNYVISVRNMIRSIPMVFIIIASLIIILEFNELVIILPSLVILLNSYFSEPGLHKYMPKQEDDNGDWRYGFQ